MTVTPGPEHLAHRDAANPRISSPSEAFAHICGTFINGKVFHVEAQQAITQQSEISVIRSSTIIHPAIQPAVLFSVW